MVTSVWPLPRPGRVDKKGFCPTWLDLRLPLGVPPSVFCKSQRCNVAARETLEQAWCSHLRCAATAGHIPTAASEMASQVTMQSGFAVTA